MTAFKICLLINQQIIIELKKDKDTEYVTGWESKGVYLSKLVALYTIFL